MSRSPRSKSLETALGAVIRAGSSGGGALPNPKLSRAVKERRGTVKPCRERSPRPRPSASRRPVLRAQRFADVAVAYADDVVAGRIVAGSWLRKACKRFQADLTRAATDSSCPFAWSPTAVQDVCAWISRLPHVEGRWGSATITLQPWQVWLLATVYGFRLKADGRRRFNTVFFEVARKSAKSTLVAGCALYHLAVENEPGAQVICGASTGQQARIVFGIMSRLVKRAAWLRELGFKAWANAITLEPHGGNAKPVNSKSSTLDGLNPSFISLDESHAQGFELHDVLKSAQGARPDAMLWAPTTAGYDLTSIGFALRSTAMKILDGVVESDHTFVALYELDEGDDWRDERVWIKAAPMVGITPTLDYLRRYRDDAIATPGLQPEFETKVCNRWLHSANSWLSMAAWDKCAEPSLTLEDFEHEPAWIGVDLAERDDIAAVAITFRRHDHVAVFVKGYLPSMVVQERARKVPQYLAWVQSGELVTTDGDMTDYAVIEQDIRDLCARFDVQRIVIERYGALHLAGNLSNSGLPAVIESKNAKVFTTPSKELEVRVRAGRLRHTGSTFLKWQASNVCVERRRDGSLLPTKESAESPNKVDAIDALLLALGAMLDTPTTAVAEPNIYVLGV
jgi:phage terminase large subunit-like protein